MSRPWTEKWFADCKRCYNIAGLGVLQGRYAHWCPDSGNLPVDETCWGFMACKCFRCKCGELLEPKAYTFNRRHVLEMHDDIFECPKSRFWNYWKHDWYNLMLDDAPRRTKLID